MFQCDRGFGDAAETKNVSIFSYDRFMPKPYCCPDSLFRTVIEIEPLIAIVWSAVRIIVTFVCPGSMISSYTARMINMDKTRLTFPRD